MPGGVGGVRSTMTGPYPDQVTYLGKVIEQAKVSR